LLDRLTRVTAVERNEHDQVAAARILLDHGRRDAVDYVASTWLAVVRDLTPRSRNGEETLAEFLMTQGPAAWEALKEGCRHPAGRQAFASLVVSRVDCRAIAKGPVEPHLLQCLSALREDESVFAHALRLPLRDREYQLQIATIADIAAARMAECWPDEHHFDPKQTSSVRRAQRQNARAGGGMVQARRDPPLPPNLVTKVTFDAALVELPDKLTMKLRELHGRELSVEALHDAALWMVIGTSDRGLALLCERTGLGDGTTIRVEPLEPGATVFGIEEDGRRWLVTTDGSLESANSDDSEPSPMADVERALQRPATTPVEITVIVGGR